MKSPVPHLKVLALKVDHLSYSKGAQNELVGEEVIGGRRFFEFFDLASLGVTFLVKLKGVSLIPEAYFQGLLLLVRRGWSRLRR